MKKRIAIIGLALFLTGCASDKMTVKEFKSLVKSQMVSHEEDVSGDISEFQAGWNEALANIDHSLTTNGGDGNVQ